MTGFRSPFASEPWKASSPATSATAVLGSPGEIPATPPLRGVRAAFVLAVQEVEVAEDVAAAVGAALLQALYAISRDAEMADHLGRNLLFRWFLSADSGRWWSDGASYRCAREAALSGQPGRGCLVRTLTAVWQAGHLFSYRFATSIELLDAWLPGFVPDVVQLIEGDPARLRRVVERCCLTTVAVAAGGLGEAHRAALAATLANPGTLDRWLDGAAPDEAVIRAARVEVRRMAYSTFLQPGPLELEPWSLREGEAICPCPWREGFPG